MLQTVHDALNRFLKGGSTNQIDVGTSKIQWDAHSIFNMKSYVTWILMIYHYSLQWYPININTVDIHYTRCRRGLIIYHLKGTTFFPMMNTGISAAYLASGLCDRWYFPNGRCWLRMLKMMNSLKSIGSSQMLILLMVQKSVCWGWYFILNLTRFCTSNRWILLHHQQYQHLQHYFESWEHDIVYDAPSLKLTFSPLGMDGWTTFSFLFGGVKRPIFRGELLISGAQCIKIQLEPWSFNVNTTDPFRQCLYDYSVNQWFRSRFVQKHSIGKSPVFIPSSITDDSQCPQVSYQVIQVESIRHILSIYCIYNMYVYIYIYIYRY